MAKITATFELTKTQKDALNFISNAENMTVAALIGKIVKDNIPSLLDIVITEDESRRRSLVDAMIKEY